MSLGTRPLVYPTEEGCLLAVLQLKDLEGTVFVLSLTLLVCCSYWLAWFITVQLILEVSHLLLSGQGLKLGRSAFDSAMGVKLGLIELYSFQESLFGVSLLSFSSTCLRFHSLISFILDYSCKRDYSAVIVLLVTTPCKQFLNVRSNWAFRTS